MILRDKRLLACAELVGGDFVCDIGTDHGYLAAYLVTSGKCSRAIAADINPMPLAAAEATVKKECISDKVTLILSDGLTDVPLNGVTDIVIAGMGGELISDIISRDERIRKDNIALVLQPMTRAETLRRWLAENGFETVCERICTQGRFSYAVMSCKYTGIYCEIDPVKAYIGYADISLPETAAYASAQAERLIRAAEGLSASRPEKSAELISIAKKIYVQIKAGDGYVHG